MCLIASHHNWSRSGSIKASHHRIAHSQSKMQCCKVVLLLALASIALVNADDRDELLKFKSRVQNWPKGIRGWDNSPHCSWQFVTCHDSGDKRGQVRVVGCETTPIDR